MIRYSPVQSFLNKSRYSMSIIPYEAAPSEPQVQGIDFTHELFQKKFLLTYTSGSYFFLLMHYFVGLRKRAKEVILLKNIFH